MPVLLVRAIARPHAAYRPDTLTEFEDFQSSVGYALITIAATPIALAILFALLDLGAARALVRCLRRGARRPRGAKRGAASVEVTDNAPAAEEKAAASVESGQAPSSNNDDGPDEEAPGGDGGTSGAAPNDVAEQDEEAAGSSIDMAAATDGRKPAEDVKV